MSESCREGKGTGAGAGAPKSLSKPSKGWQKEGTEESHEADADGEFPALSAAAVKSQREDQASDAAFPALPLKAAQSRSSKDQAERSVHRKDHTMKNLEDDDVGGNRSMAGDACQTACETSDAESTAQRSKAAKRRDRKKVDHKSGSTVDADTGTAGYNDTQDADTSEDEMPPLEENLGKDFEAQEDPVGNAAGSEECDTDISSVPQVPRVPNTAGRFAIGDEVWVWWYGEWQEAYVRSLEDDDGRIQVLWQSEWSVSHVRVSHVRLKLQGETYTWVATRTAS